MQDIYSIMLEESRTIFFATSKFNVIFRHEGFRNCSHKNAIMFIVLY